ncbi:amidase [Streptacidiphilus sp. PB12-B1b]|nr:amidase [Streptacidiphilus sp. PB12-B1b]
MLTSRIEPFVGWLRDAPVLPPTGDGPLRGLRLAVKDVLDVAGLPTGAGHPDWLRAQGPALADAEAVARLRAAGASVVGKTHTDELAYSLDGDNAHYGAPRNPAAPDRLCGGSSSGSASAVALGAADLGLGTDTAGSIRVPASYCGLFGFRPSHRGAPRAGIVPLAPSYDVPGLLARDAATLDAGLRALLGGPGEAWLGGVAPDSDRLLVPDDLWSAVSSRVREALRPLLDRFGTGMAAVDRTPWFGPGSDTGRWQEVRTAFITVQAAEAWACHGEWIERARPRFGPGVAERFARAATVTPGQQQAARATVAEAARQLGERLAPGSVLALPTTPGPAAPVASGAADPGRRAATVALTCLASGAGAPAVSVPGTLLDGAPIGLCLVAAPGADEQLMALLARVVPGAP